jgi:hypothetical protein
MKPIYTFSGAKQVRDHLEMVYIDTLKELMKVSGPDRGSMGLTPDHIKKTPEWRAAYYANQFAMNNATKHNAFMVKHFKNEMKAERDMRRAEKLAKTAK